MQIEALFKVSYGLYIVSSYNNNKLNAQIANAVIQVTAEPIKFAVVLNKKNLTTEFIENSKVFAISVLAQDTPMEFIGRFGFKSGRDFDKFSGINYKKGITGAPIITENTVSYIECKVINTYNVGTHLIFIGEAIEYDFINKELIPMTYDYYFKVKKGLAAKNAPTFVKKKNSKPKEVEKMNKYRCTVCGYVYDPAKGDPDNGIKPGTSFEDIPDDWVCPICGAGKSDFEKVE